MSIAERAALVEPIATALGLLRAFEMSGDRNHIDAARHELHRAATAIMDAPGAA